MTDAEIMTGLIELQKVDCEIIKLEDEKLDLTSQIAVIKKQIDDNKAQFDLKKKMQEDFKKKKQMIDIEIKSREEEIKRKETQTSQIKTNDAFKALQDEMNNLRTDIKKYEDDILANMEKEEEVAKDLKAQEALVKKGESELNVQIKELEAKVAGQDGLIAAQTEKRNAVIKNVDRNWYERYERIRKNKRTALVPIHVDERGNGICGGCKFTVRPQMVIQVKKKQVIHTCENCARLWFIEETPKEAPAGEEKK